MRRLGRRGIGVVALVTALVLALGVESSTHRSALAAPGAPSWDDVEQAKGDVEATEIAVSRIIDTVRGLEEQYAATARRRTRTRRRHGAPGGPGRRAIVASGRRRSHRRVADER